jgi:hypothetical protein
LLDPTYIARQLPFIYSCEGPATCEVSCIVFFK